MTVRLTQAEARRAGIDLPSTSARPRTTRKVARGAAYHTRCKTPGCGEEFHTEAAEERHLIAAHHARFELVL